MTALCAIRLLNIYGVNRLHFKLTLLPPTNVQNELSGVGDGQRVMDDENLSDLT